MMVGYCLVFVSHHDALLVLLLVLINQWLLMLSNQQIDLI